MNYNLSKITGQVYSPLSGGGVTTVNTNAQLSTSTIGTTQDDGAVLVTLPFTFNYNGSAFTQMTMCTNGFIGCGDQTALTAAQSNTGGNLWTTTLPNNTISPWFKNNGGNFPNGGGSMRYGLTGTDVCTFQWNKATGTTTESQTVQISYQVKIYGPASSNPGRIEFIYGPTLGAIATSANVGLEDATGGTNHYINAMSNGGLFNQNGGAINGTTTSAAWPGNGNGYRFDPIPSCSGAPVNQTTALILTPIMGTQINGSFTNAASNPNAYLVVRYTGATPTITSPVNGTSYAVGGSLGTGIVVVSGAASSFSATGLANSTTYTFVVYSFCATGTPTYNTTSPLTGVASTGGTAVPNCAQIFAPSNGETNVPVTQLLTWAGSLASPAVSNYDVYLSTNSTLVANEDLSVRVIAATTSLNFTPVQPLNPGTTYYWKIVSRNTVGLSAGCAVNSFTTLSAGAITANASGGLWSSAATWASGVIPFASDNVVIPDGVNVTLDVAAVVNNLTIGNGSSGILQWGANTVALTVTGNLQINSGAQFFPYSTAGAGQTINLYGDFTNNGYTDLDLTALIFNGSGTQNLNGSGTFAGQGGKGIVATIQMQGSGTLFINPSQSLIVRGTLNPLRGTINTNGKLEIDNTAQMFGQALNDRLEYVAMTSMGTLLTAAPSISGTGAALWAASTAVTAGAVRVSGVNVYLATVGGTTSTTAPTHGSGTATDGGVTWLWEGNTGTIGNPLILTVVAGTQYFYGANLYTCTVGGTLTAVQAAATPPTHTSGNVVVAGSTVAFQYVGSAATLSNNYDVATGTVRSVNITNAGSGYQSSPAIVFVAATGTVPSAATLVLSGITGSASFTAQKQATATITGSLPINTSQGVGGVGASLPVYGRYATAPAVAIGGPTGINFVTAGTLASGSLSGYTSAPTVTFTGGTLLSGSNSFTTVVGNGKILNVQISTSGLYSVPPTAVTIAGGGGPGAVINLPANCWAVVTSNINANGLLTSYNIGTSGFGYTVAPSMFISAPAAGELAATTPTCRVGLYNLTCSNFSANTINGIAPITTNALHTETSLGNLMPSSRRINTLALGGGCAGVSLTGNTTLYGTSPITLTAGPLDMGSNVLTFESPSYLGQSAGASSFVVNASMVLNGISTGTLTRTFPFRAAGATGAFQLSIGSGSNATGSDITQIMATQMGAPSGTATGVSSTMIGNRAIKVDILSGTVFGTPATSPTALLAWDGLDQLNSDNASLYLCQSNTGLSSGWAVRSAAGAAGTLTGTGSRTSATSGNGPIVFANTMYFGWSSSYVPVPLQYNIARTTGNSYSSIVSPATGSTLTWNTSFGGDEVNSNVVTIPSSTFTYNGQLITGFQMNLNGWAHLISASVPAISGAFNTYNGISLSNIQTPSSFITNSSPSGGLGSIQFTIAPFWSDLTTAASSTTYDNFMRYKIIGATAGSRQIVIEWYNMTIFNNNGPQLNFQIVLDETDNSIKFNYGLFQQFNGTANIGYQTTIGINGMNSPLNGLAGQVLAQQYENSDVFSSNNCNFLGGDLTGGNGANRMAIAPDCNSSIKFTPGTGYAGGTIPSTSAPVNDEPAGAIAVSALSAFPSNLCGNFYSSRYTTKTTSVPVCAGNNDDDVWFKFTANDANTQVKIYGSGGYIPRVQILDASLNPLSPAVCSVGGYGSTILAVIAATPGNLYYVRVYHEGGGVQATGVANIAGGLVTGVTMTNFGSGYAFGTTNGTAISGVSSPRVTFTGGGGKDALGTAVLAGVSPNDSVTSITMNAGGYGYTSAPTVTIESPNWSVTGEFAIVVYAQAANDECATAITLTNPSNTTCVTGQNQIVNVATAAAGPSVESACSGTPDDDVWYKFTGTGYNQITVTGVNGYDPAFEVWNGGISPGSCGSKTSVLCVNTTGAGAVETSSLTTVPGNIYYVRVYHAGTGAGSSGDVFNICVTGPIPTCISSPNSPTNGGTGCNGQGIFLSWPTSAIATGYDVYFNSGSSATSLVSSNQAGTTYNPGSLTAGQYAWRVVPRNANGSATGCSDWTFTSIDPQVTGSTPGSRCGTGTVTLSATGSSGSTINWYAAASGGSAIASGNSFTTPVISATTPYYASASVGGTGSNLNLLNSPSLVSSGSGTFTLGYAFTPNANITVTAFRRYFGSKISIWTSTGTLVYSQAVTGTDGVWSNTTLTSPVNLTAGTTYVIAAYSNGGSYYWTTTGPTTFADGTITAGLEISGDAFPSTTDIDWWYVDLVYNKGCESARTMVTATVTTAPAITASGSSTICNGGSASLSVSSPNDPNYAYSWTSSPAGFTGSGNGPFTVNPTVTTTYTVNAVDNSTLCANTANVIVNVQPASATISSNPANFCITGGVATLNLTPSSGYPANTIQWQTSATGGVGTYSNISGANASTYTTPSISATTYYQAIISNSNNVTCLSPQYALVVNNPQVTGTTPPTRCGPGTVNYTATVNSGSTAAWYAAATGGTPLATGSPYTTSITANTTYYVSAVAGAGIVSGLGNTGIPPDNSGWTAQRGIVFDAAQGFTLVSAQYYSSTLNVTNSVTVVLQNNAGTQLQTTTLSIPQGASASFYTMNLNWIIPPGTGYRLLATFSQTVQRDLAANYSLAAYNNLSPVGTITSGYDGAVSTTTYNYFHNITITAGCESARTAVTATLVSPPAITPVSSIATICNGGSASLSVSSPNDPNYAYSWTSSPAGFTGSGNGPFTVNPTVTTTYTVNALDNSTSCANTANVTVNVQPASATISSNPANFCITGGVATLSLTPSSGYPSNSIQWQTSSTGGVGTYSNISGANASTYTTPAISATTYYQAIISNSNNVTCLTPQYTLAVNNPVVISTTPATRCGAGSVSLAAAVNSGSTATWYTAATGGIPIATGSPYTTNVATNTTYYVSAVAGAGTVSGLGADNVTIPEITGASAQRGIVFDVANQFTLISAQYYSPTLSVTNSVVVVLQDNTGTQLQTVTLPITQGATAGWYTLNLNWLISPGTGYRLLASFSQSVNRTNLANYTQSPWNNLSPVGTIISGYDGGVSTTEYNYFHNITISAGCESARTAVTATVTPAPNIFAVASVYTPCTGNSTQLSVSSSNASYTYSWTSSPAGFTATGTGPFTVSPTANITYNVTAVDNTTGTYAGCGDLAAINITPTVNNLTVNVSSSATSVCSGGNVNLTATASSSATYCIPAYTNWDGSDAITNVTLNTINNTTDNPGLPCYSNFTGTISTSLTAGSVYSISVTDGSFSSSENIAAWIDFDQSGTFDVGEQILPAATSTVAFQVFTASFTVPSTAKNGTTRLRVVDMYSTAVNACGTGAGFGETEDYGITISGGVGGAGGFSYNWSSNPTFLSATNISNPIAQAMTSSQTYSVLVTDVSTGCTKSASKAIAVNPLPDPSISNAGAVCEGFPITLGASNNAPGQSTGNTYLWSTDAVTSYSSTSSTASVTSNATVNNSGNYTVVITNSFLCTASATDVVTVNPNPVLNSSSISNVINESCPGAADGSFQATASSGTAPFDYSIDGGNSSNQSGSFTGLTPGTYTVQVVSDFNGCVSASTPVTITSPNLPPTVSCPGNQAANAAAGLCSAVVSYSTPSTGIPAPDVTYAFTGATTGSGTGNGSGSAFNVGTTTVTVTVSNSCGTDACSFDVVITDNQNPVISCPANIAICNPTAQAVSFTVNATDNCSIASVVSTPASGSIFPVGTTTVNSVATDVNGNTSTCSFTVTISTPSTAPTSATTDAANNNICLGNSVILTQVGGSIGTGAIYKWYSGSCGGTLVGTGASITLSPTATTTYYVRAEGACNTTACASVTVVVSTSPVTSLALMPFTGMPANVCAGTVATLSIAPVSRATYYVWDVPTGSYFNGVVTNVSPFTTTTPSVTVTFGSPSGSLYNIGVQAGNACGTSVRQSQKVRGLTSVPASVSGPTTACANSTVTYSTAAVTGATSYLWTVTGNATVSGTGTTATVSFGAGYTGGTVCVAAQTTCYTSPAKCITISTSASTLNAISGTFTACPNSTLTYSVPASTGAASYTWTLPPGATGSSTTNSINVTYGAGYSAVGSICVSVTSTCGVTSAVKCKTVAPGLPSQPASISGALTGLCNQTIVYSTPSQGSGITYTWTSPGTINTGQGSTSISTTFAALSTGNVCVTASNSCGSSTARCVPVKGAPNAPGAITATPPSWCANTSGIEFDVNTASLTGTYTLSWTFPPAAVATYVIGGGNSNSLILDWKTGSGNVNVTASNACGGSTKTSTWSSTCREGSLATVSSISVSPNPTTGILNINYTSTKGSTVINVLDLAGRVVMTQTTSSIDGANATQIDLGKVAKGAYMLSVQSTQGNKQVRVVVE